MPLPCVAECRSNITLMYVVIHAVNDKTWYDRPKDLCAAHACSAAVDCNCYDLIWYITVMLARAVG